MQVHYTPASQADKDAAERILHDAAYGAAYSGPQTIASMRAGTEALTAHGGVRQVAAQAQVVAQAIAGVPCETITAPGTDTRRTMLYLHGGAFIRGNLGLGRANAALLAQASGLRVIAVGYRQAPEHPYPAAPSDVRAVYLALLESGVAAADITVTGESSGGCLALGLVADLQARGIALPAAVATLSPMADLDLRGASWTYNAGKDVAARDMGCKAIDLYIDPSRRQEPVASPVHYDFAHCSRLFIGIGSHETMLSDAEYLARKAADAGTEVCLHVYEGMPHGFTRFDSAIGTQAVVDAARWCQERMSPG